MSRLTLASKNVTGYFSVTGYFIEKCHGLPQKMSREKKNNTRNHDLNSIFGFRREKVRTAISNYVSN